MGERGDEGKEGAWEYSTSCSSGRNQTILGILTRISANPCPWAVNSIPIPSHFQTMRGMRRDLISRRASGSPHRRSLGSGRAHPRSLVHHPRHPLERLKTKDILHNPLFPSSSLSKTRAFPSKASHHLPTLQFLLLLPMMPTTSIPRAWK